MWRLKMNKYKQLYQKSMLDYNGLLDKINSGEFNPRYMPSFDKVAYTNMLSCKDRSQCVNRYLWNGLELNLTTQKLETFYYEFFSLCVFEDEQAGGKMVFYRFTRVGDLTRYGELDKIQPIDFSGKAYGPVRSVISANHQPELKPGEPFAVIICDYTPPPFLDTAVPRSAINLSTTIKDEVTVYNQLHTNIVLSVKKALALCDNEDQKNVMLQQVADMLDPSKPIAVLSASKQSKGSNINDQVQFVNFNNTFDTQNYCQTIDYYDKIRRGFNGIPSPDTFEKKERKITAEAENTMAHSKLVLYDGYMQRKLGLDLFNKYTQNRHNVTVRINNEMFDDESDDVEDDNKEVKDDSESVR